MARHRRRQQRRRRSRRTGDDQHSPVSWSSHGRIRSPRPPRLPRGNRYCGADRTGASRQRAPQTRLLITGKKFEVAAAGAVVAVVVVAGLLLSAWRGFPKGVDAYQHLTRLNFVADWFPHHNRLYAWAAGMPRFDNNPRLPYVAAPPVLRLPRD